MMHNKPSLVLPPLNHPDIPDLCLAYVQPDDWPLLVELENASHVTPWRPEHFRQSLASHHHVIGLWQRVGGSFSSVLLGHAVVTTVAGESEILLFVIAKAWQGKGLGRTFLHALLEALTGVVDQVFLEVRASNIPAIALYDSLGFNQIGERKGYYETPWGREDAIVLALDVSWQAL